MKSVRNVFQSTTKCYLFIGYVSISLMLGECHPFTQVPMYNSFPNYAYTFYLADSNHKPLLGLPVKYNSGFISHQYCAFAEEKNIFHGFCKETTEQNLFLGKSILDQFINDPQKKLPYGKIELHRISFVYSGNKILKNDITLYSSYNEVIR